MELNELAQDLLTKLSNSLYERESNKIEICFSIKEIQLVENWLFTTLYDEILSKIKSPN